MCGIVGALVRPSSHSATHDGRFGPSRPRRPGLHEALGIALRVRRLSIIEVPGGHQPIANEDSTVVVAFNGEIYKHAQLRKDSSGNTTESLVQGKMAFADAKALLVPVGSGPSSV